MRKQTSTFGTYQTYLAECATSDASQSVVMCESLIHESVIGKQEVECALVATHNKAFGKNIVVNPPQEDPASSRIEVHRPVVPIAKLTLWRKSAYVICFAIERTESSFAHSKHSKGRMEVMPDHKRNLNVVFEDGTRLPTPQAVAEHLLEPIFFGI